MSESDDRQAMSIDLQIKEMMAMADREALNVAEARRESFSVNNQAIVQFLMNIAQATKSEFNAIFTWAPE